MEPFGSLAQEVANEISLQGQRKSKSTLKFLHRLVVITWMPMMPSREAPTLLFSEKESADAKEQWRGNCGPHALAAAGGISLEDAKRALPSDFRGTMSPTQMKKALEHLGIACTITKKLRTQGLRNGLGYVQWIGRWLSSAYKSEKYSHTHWIASQDGWVFDTMMPTFGWMKEDVWKKEFNKVSLAEGEGWYFWQWFEF